ncbi:hypothetical protein GPALN_012533 [Globodera pallida]|nr:hypothetical protein GPALN_012533 [Globodera pallida]
MRPGAGCRCDGSHQPFFWTCGVQAGDLGNNFANFLIAITFLAIPHNSIDNEPRVFGLTSRYKELSALYATLSTIHRQLYLKGKCPPFAEPKYFGATDAQTVAERKDSIECFLQFVLNNEVLCKSVKFQQFLESAKEMEEVVEEPIKRSDAAEAEELAAEPNKDIATKQFD